MSQCAVQRGVGLYQGTQSAGFDGNKSTTYLDLAEIDLLSLGSDAQITDLCGKNYSVPGSAGLDYLTIEYANGSPFSSNATVPILGIIDWKFFLPTVGLGFGNWTSNAHWALSFMSDLANKFTIPSRTWGYTAGARYRKSGLIRFPSPSTELERIHGTDSAQVVIRL